MAPTSSRASGDGGTEDRGRALWGAAQTLQRRGSQDYED